MMSVPVYSKPLLLGVSLAVCSLLSPEKLSADGSDASVALEPGPPLKVSMYTLLLEFNEEHALGSRTETENLKSAMRESGIYGVRDLLSNEGSVQLLTKGEQEGHRGVRISQFIGQEVPFITSAAADDDSGMRRTTTQSTVSSGTRSELRILPATGNNWSLEYRVDADRAFPVERDGRTLIGRSRLNWSGTTTVESTEPILIGRFTRDDEGKPVEYIFIYEVREMMEQSPAETE